MCHSLTQIDKDNFEPDRSLHRKYYTVLSDNIVSHVPSSLVDLGGNVLCCRLVSSNQQDFMISANIPLKWSRKSHQGSYIVKWELNDWTPLKCVAISNTMLTAMSVA